MPFKLVATQSRAPIKPAEIIIFWSNANNPSLKMKGHIPTLQARFPETTFTSFNVDTQQEIGLTVDAFGTPLLTGLPLCVRRENGKEVQRIVGSRSLQRMIEEFKLNLVPSLATT